MWKILSYPEKQIVYDLYHLPDWEYNGGFQIMTWEAVFMGLKFKQRIV